MSSPKRLATLGAARFPSLLAFLLGTVLFAACGKGESSSRDRGASNGSPDAQAALDAANRDASRPASVTPTPATGPSSEAPDVDPFADLSGTLVEKAGLLPIGFFTLTFSGVERQCMGSYLGQGRFVTAGHCFLGLPNANGVVNCPSDLRIRWLAREGEAFPLSNDKAACQKAVVTYREGADPMDVAVVTLDTKGTWPSVPLRLVNGGAALGKKVAMVGPQGTGASLYFRAYVGEAYESDGKIISTNSAHKAGYSGTPVFLFTESGGPFDPSAGALGMHLGSSNGKSRMLRGEAIEPFLN